MYYGTMSIMKCIRQRKNILNYRKDCRVERTILQRQFFLSILSGRTVIASCIRAFLRYVDGKAAEGVFVQEVDEEVRRVKQHDETRREYMTLAMELKRQRQGGIAEGLAESSANEKKKIIVTMLQKGLSVEFIADCVQTSAEYIIELGKKQHLL